MTVCTLDDSDLDDEDRAILAEVKNKGYYHGRPKSQACAAPAKIEATPAPRVAVLAAAPSTAPAAAAAAPAAANAATAAAGPLPGSRTQFDDFQRKWDRFDNDDWLDEIEHGMVVKEAALKPSNMPEATRATSSKPPPLSKPLQTPAVAEFKVLLVGDTGVGKTAFVQSHLTGEFQRIPHRPSGVNVQEMRLRTNCGEISFRVWDLAADGSRESRHAYGQGHAAIIMFAVTSRKSYERGVPNWQRQIKSALGVIPTVLVGNKIDVPLRARQVKAKQILFHRNRHLQYYDLSVKTRHNIEKPFLWLARRLAGQPSLELVGDYARAPQVVIESALAAEHERLLREAQSCIPCDTDSEIEFANGAWKHIAADGSEEVSIGGCSTDALQQN